MEDFQFVAGPGGWSCRKCTLDNPASESACLACGAGRRGGSERGVARRGGTDWSCPACTLRNPGEADRCGACETVRKSAVQHRPVWTCQVPGAGSTQNLSDTLFCRCARLRTGRRRLPAGCVGRSGWRTGRRRGGQSPPLAPAPSSSPGSRAGTWRGQSQVIASTILPLILETKNYGLGPNLSAVLDNKFSGTLVCRAKLVRWTWVTLVQSLVKS